MVTVGFRIDQAKSLFFDQPKVVSAVSRAERRVLSRFGSYVRADAKASIRRRKRASQPGQPPTNRTGLLKKHIFFVYEARRRSVVIGPALLGRSTGAQQILEHGGSVVIRRRVRRRGRRRSSAPKQTRQRVTVAPRPFMGPAFEKNRDQKLPALWKDAVVGRR